MMLGLPEDVRHEAAQVRSVLDRADAGGLEGCGGQGLKGATEGLAEVTHSATITAWDQVGVVVHEVEEEQAVAGDPREEAHAGAQSGLIAKERAAALGGEG